jgi:hypothetical protein
MYIPSKSFLKTFWCFVSLILIILNIHSCQNDPVSDNEFDYGSYSVDVYPDYLRSYAGGGGCFIFQLAPSSDFSGKVLLNVEADSKLGTKLSYNYISEKLRISEISFHTAPDIDTGLYTIFLHVKHNDKDDKVTVFVQIVKYDSTVSNYWSEEYLKFANYINNNDFGYMLRRDNKWQRYSNNIPPVCYIRKEFLDESFQITFDLPCQFTPVYFKIRKRNFETAPSLILIEEQDGTIHRE